MVDTYKLMRLISEDQLSAATSIYEYIDFDEEKKADGENMSVK